MSFGSTLDNCKKNLEVSQGHNPSQLVFLMLLSKLIVMLTRALPSMIGYPPQEHVSSQVPTSSLGGPKSIISSQDQAQRLNTIAWHQLSLNCFGLNSLDLFFLREKVLQKELHVTRSCAQCADILTKALSPSKLEECGTKLTVCNAAQAHCRAYRGVLREQDTHSRQICVNLVGVLPCISQQQINPHNLMHFGTSSGLNLKVCLFRRIA